MKTKFIALILLIIAGCMFSSCDSDSSTQSSGDVVADGTYFPAEDGTSYKYNVDKVNDTQTSGSRSSLYSGTTVHEGVIYQIQIDSLTLSGLTTVNNAFFRKTDTGIFFFLDTTGISASIPDSLLSSLIFDTEMRIFLFPINEGGNWPVFKMTLNIQGFPFSPVEVSANYVAKENLTLDLIRGNENVETVKIRFRLSIRTSPLSAGVNYDAFAWLAKNIGIVKWQGNGTIINAFTGGGIVFADTSSTVTQNLVEYDVN